MNFGQYSQNSRRNMKLRTKVEYLMFGVGLAFLALLGAVLIFSTRVRAANVADGGVKIKYIGSIHSGFGDFYKYESV
jgi:hypothetical protein